MSTKTYRIFKKLSSVIMVFALLFGLLTVSSNTITAKAADSPVKMYSCDGETIYHAINTYTVYIQIEASSAGNKAVAIHYRTYENKWCDENATFFTKLNSETEIWKAEVTGPQLTEYAIKYVGDGVTYWDNNNGNNYQFSQPLGVANILALRYCYKTAENYKIYAAVKNLAYSKVVKVRYTEDNWATYQDVALQYDYSLATNNTEIWTTTLKLDPNKIDQFHYCLSYEVNGQTYWDNNFGANYGYYYYSPY
ncbi:MAG: CBM21 domain-containing protein [Lachnospiraceae bacterium]|nr:CBM21 domain-containing protein [Lachnospiraceae bacterium]